MEKMPKMPKRRDGPVAKIGDVGQPFPFTSDEGISAICKPAAAPTRNVEKPRVKSGIYREMDSTTYFSDPTPQPSLSQSIAKVLLDNSPAHARLDHPRLCPPSADDAEPDAEKYMKAQAIGNAAHKLLLGRGKEVDVLEYNDFRTKEAKLARDLAEKAGRVVILEKHMTNAEQMVAAAWAQLEIHEARETFKNGSGEVAVICEQEGVWLRSLVDWLSHDLRDVQDYKSGGVSVAPHVVGMRMVDQGWDIQAAMHERILDELDPNGRGRRRHRFIAQENKPPYALTVCELSESVMTMGRKKLQAAINIWRDCIEMDFWPGYTNRIISPEYPGWQETRWLEREINEFSEPAKRGPMLKSLMGG
jgi:hypothetical protein